jgi:hypothetical protein
MDNIRHRETYVEENIFDHLVERERYPSRPQQRRVRAVHREASAGYPLPAGDQGAPGSGRDRPAGVRGILELR